MHIRSTQEEDSGIGGSAAESDGYLYLVKVAPV
jgi:hypothetical protein